MADDETSDAKRAITVPFADGLMTPSMMAMLPAVREVAFAAAGMSYAVAELTVSEVAVSV
jgi:hypothetical protein